MDTKDISYETFLAAVCLDNQGFVNEINEYLTQNGCKLKVTSAKSGYVASYNHTKSKKVIINFVFRKNDVVIRIYGDNVNNYLDFIETLPDFIVKEFAESPDCKRLLDPSKCNSRCPMGYDFIVNGKRYQKCRYSCFMFEVNDESRPFIKAFVENEVTKRIA